MIRTADDEARLPKYAHIERERRWLVDPSQRPALDPDAFILIEDRYLDGTRMRLRRMSDSTTGTVAFKLTKKYECPDPCARPIVTAYLTEAEHAVLAQLPGVELFKRRYPLRFREVIFSVDCFSGSLTGLELAEIEWPDEAGLKALAAPDWTMRDVSDDTRYQGGNLVRYGIPKE